MFCIGATKRALLSGWLVNARTRARTSHICLLVKISCALRQAVFLGLSIEKVLQEREEARKHAKR